MQILKRSKMMSECSNCELSTSPTLLLSLHVLKNIKYGLIQRAHTHIDISSEVLSSDHDGTLNRGR